MKLFTKLPETTDTHELLRRIDSKDRAFRITQAVFFALMTTALAMLLVFSVNIQRANNSLLKQSAERAKVQTGQINDLQKHIDCIVSLFALPNRASQSITDIENCKINGILQPKL